MQVISIYYSTDTDSPSAWVNIFCIRTNFRLFENFPGRNKKKNYIMKLNLSLLKKFPIRNKNYTTNKLEIRFILSTCTLH